jgi:hypothetical protein
VAGRERRFLRWARRVVVAGALVLTLAPTAVAAAAAPGSVAGGQVSSQGAGSLESAASRAGATGRKVAVSLIGLALAVAAIVLAFKRDFKEAVGVLAIGALAVLLASPAGLSVLQDTVSTLFGGG